MVENCDFDEFEQQVWKLAGHRGIPLVRLLVDSTGVADLVAFFKRVFVLVHSANKVSLGVSD